MPKSASSPLRKLFDYDSLDSADAVFVQQQTGAIQSLMKRSAQDIVEIGQRLIEIKKRLGHGRFGSWLEAEFNWDERTARRFMSVADKFSGKTDKLSEINLAPSALYLLATASTPETARKEAITRAQLGEPISYTAAKSIKQKYTPLKKASQNSALQVAPPQPDNLQGRAMLSTPTPPQGATATPPEGTSLGQNAVSYSTQIDGLQSPGVKYTPPQPLPSSSTPQAASTPPAPPVSSVVPTSRLEEQQTPVPGSQTQAASVSAQQMPRQRVTESAPSRLEILAIRPREADPEISEEDEGELVDSPKKSTPRFVQPGTWWQLAEEHLLFCGDPASPRFLKRLPDKIALSLAFPPSRSEWPKSPSEQIGSSLVWFTRYQNDQDFQTFRRMVKGALLLATEGGDAVVFSFLPDPELLFLAYELECRWFCAEPDAVKCEAAIALWRGKGFRTERVSGLRF